jgi:Ca2+-binding EF-hand superfamily protein
MSASHLHFRRGLFVAAAILVCNSGFVVAQTAAPGGFDKLDINEDGVLSGVEMKSVAARDADGDGRVTRAEFDGAGSKPSGGSTAAAEQKFVDLDISEDGYLSGREMRGLERLDLDKDGRVTKQEYLQASSTEPRGAEDKPAAPGITPPPAAPTGTLDLRSLVDKAWADADKARADLDKKAIERADKLFNAFDGNEDGKLSGTEIPTQFKAYDTNQDGRLTREELHLGVAPPRALRPGVTPPPGASTATKSDLDPLVAAFQTGDIGPVMADINERGKKAIDELVLQFIVDTFRKEYGEITPPSAMDVKVTSIEIKGEKIKETWADVKFARGTATLRIAKVDGKLEGIQIGSPLMEQINEIHTGLLLSPEGKELARKFNDTFAPRGEHMLRLIIDGNDQEAFKCFYPEVQQELGWEKVQAYFARNRGAMGAVEKIECTGITAKFDEGKPKPNFILEYDLPSADAGLVNGFITFRIIGVKAHIISLQFKKADK